jgi:hypothetical protein
MNGDRWTLPERPLLSLQVTYPRRRRKVVGRGPPPALFAVFVVFGSAVTPQAARGITDSPHGLTSATVIEILDHCYDIAPMTNELSVGYGVYLSSTYSPFNRRSKHNRRLRAKRNPSDSALRGPGLSYGCAGA